MATCLPSPRTSLLDEPDMLDIDGEVLINLQATFNQDDDNIHGVDSPIENNG